MDCKKGQQKYIVIRRGPDAKSYQAAQKALKTEEEQTFSEEEIDIMLPNSIRRCNRKISDD